MSDQTGTNKMETTTSPKPVLAVSNASDREEAPPPKNRRPFLIIGALAVVMVVTIGGYALLTAGQETTDDAQVEAGVVPVAPRTGGQVQKIAVEENQVVKKGDLIL